MLLVFFTSVGSREALGAQVGRQAAPDLCAATVIPIVAQNFAGIAVAMGFGANPYYGVLVGGISFVGGPGTGGVGEGGGGGRAEGRAGSPSPGDARRRGRRAGRRSR
jgi:Na+/glutamate symporter